MYGTNILYSASLFQSQQMKWNLFKKTVIKLDWLLSRADYSPSLPADLTLLKQKVRHMLAIKDPMSPKYLKKSYNYLDKQLRMSTL
jgi:hypothetical protein